MATSSSQPRCCWAEPGEAGRQVTRTTSSSRGRRRGMLFLLGCVGAYPCASARTPLSTTLSGQVHQVSLRKTLREGKIVQAVAKAAERRVSKLSGDLPSCPHTTGHLLCLCGRVFNFWAGKGCVGAAGAGRECRQPGQAGSHQRNGNIWLWQVRLGETFSLAGGTSTPTGTFKTTPSVHGLVF